MKLTRRQIAAAIAAASTGVSTAVAAAQAQPAADDLTAARDRVKATANALSSVPLPMSTEPAFQFKA